MPPSLCAARRCFSILRNGAIPCYRVCYRLSRKSPRFREHRLVHEPCVALRRYDRGMSEQLLKGGEATTPFDPPASERVPELVDVEAPHLAQNPHPGVELPR